MIINAPEIKKANGEISVSSLIEFETDKSRSRVLWYRLSEEYEQYIADRSDAFVTAMLPHAMLSGEDIEVNGSLSSKLSYGLKLYQGYFNFYFPGKLKKVKINCDNLISEYATRPSGVASSFSGGVDSFYTLYCHIPENEENPLHRIGFLIFVHGFDIPLTDTTTYDFLKKEYAKLAENVGAKLLPVSTNVKEFLANRKFWEMAHGAAVISVPLLLNKLISRFYIPSSHTYDFTSPWGSNSNIDHLLSTATCDVIHHDSGMTRLGKIKGMSIWEETYDRLRVCWEKPDINNCCRCEKCIRTMISLELAGVLKKYKTFPLPLEPNAIKEWALKNESDISFARELVDYAARMGRKDIEENIRFAISKAVNKLKAL